MSVCKERVIAFNCFFLIGSRLCFNNMRVYQKGVQVLLYEVPTYLLTYLLSYLLTPWSRVFLEKLTGLQLVKKFPAFYGIRRFITVFTIARHLSLS